MAAIGVHEDSTIHLNDSDFMRKKSVMRYQIQYVQRCSPLEALSIVQ